MITVTKIRGGHTATIAVREFGDTVTDWFEDASEEILDVIDDVQRQLNYGAFITGSAIDSLGLVIVAGEERKLRDTENSDAVLQSDDEWEPYSRALGLGLLLRRVADDYEITADTMTVDLIEYTEPHTGETRYAVQHDDAATAIVWDYPTETAATARFEDHLRRMTETGASFVTEDDEENGGEILAPTVTVDDVVELLDSTAVEPVMYVDNRESELRVSVWPNALVSHHAIILTKEAALNDLGLEDGAQLSTQDREYIAVQIVPTLQNEVVKIVANRFTDRG